MAFELNWCCDVNRLDISCDRFYELILARMIDEGRVYYRPDKDTRDDAPVAKEPPTLDAYNAVCKANREKREALKEVKTYLAFVVKMLPEGANPSPSLTDIWKTVEVALNMRGHNIKDQAIDRVAKQDSTGDLTNAISMATHHVAPSSAPPKFTGGGTTYANPHYVIWLWDKDLPDSDGEAVNMAMKRYDNLIWFQGSTDIRDLYRNWASDRLGSPDSARPSKFIAPENVTPNPEYFKWLWDQSRPTDGRNTIGIVASAYEGPACAPTIAEIERAYKEWNDR